MIALEARATGPATRGTSRAAPTAAATIATRSPILSAYVPTSVEAHTNNTNNGTRRGSSGPRAQAPAGTGMRGVTTRSRLRREPGCSPGPNTTTPSTSAPNHSPTRRRSPRARRTATRASIRSGSKRSCIDPERLGKHGMRPATSTRFPKREMPELGG